MAKIKDLIHQLQLLDPEDSILFQYMTSEFLDMHEYQFADVVEYLDDNSTFADDSADVLKAWINEAVDVLDEVARQEEEDED